MLTCFRGQLFRGISLCSPHRQHQPLPRRVYSAQSQNHHRTNALVPETTVQRPTHNVLALINSLQLGRRIKALHTTAFSKFLLLTNVTISLGLSSAGDILEQQYECYTGELAEWNGKRTTHMAISGVSVGVICHYWYQLLDSRLPGRTIRVVMKKIVLDQLICSPVYISAFFVTLGILEGKPAAEVWQEMKEKAWKLYAAEWMIWPVAQFVNFYWLPTRYRVFYDNLISLGYDVYTSQVKHHD